MSDRRINSDGGEWVCEVSCKKDNGRHYPNPAPHTPFSSVFLFSQNGGILNEMLAFWDLFGGYVLT